MFGSCQLTWNGIDVIISRMSMETTGEALVEHWNWAIEKGLMNRNTAGSLRAACTQVLGVAENWKQIDVMTLDPEDLLNRFRNLRARDFTPESLEAYGRRFRAALRSFKSYIESPNSWKPANRERNGLGSESSRRAKAVSKSASTSPSDARDEPIPSQRLIGLVDYPFPLREGVNARLVLPRDLTKSEVRRLSGFMAALAVDDQEGA